MRIGMILKAKIPPPDIRVEKEAKTLSGAGHDVHLLLERRRAERIEERYKGIDLLRGVEMGFARERWHRYTFSFTFKDPLWRGAIERFARERAVDALHVHDLPLVGEAVTVARALGLPVVADLHENYPAGLQVWYESRFKKRTIYHFERWAAYERRILREVDAVIAVIEESKERLAGLGLPRDRIFVVPNTASGDRIDIPIDRGITDRYRGSYVISYIGGFASHRGLDVAVRAVPRLRERIPNVRLVLVGDRNKAYRAHLGRLAAELGCADLVEMTGWQPFEAIWSFIEASDICLVPHSRNPHTDTTIPHKIFQYMLAGKPVIVSDCPPLARIIRDAGAGLVFTYDDPRELAARILEIHGDGELAGRFAAAGRAAVADRYNWDSTSGDLLRLDEGLGARAGGAR
jgi:glycosyltransferase involved in cell wall biosynthesis